MIRSCFFPETTPGEPGRIALVRLAGPVDAVDRGRLDRLLFDLAGIARVQLDLSDVGFAGSVLADFLVRLDRSARRAGGRVLLAGRVPLHVGRLLVLTGLDDRFARRPSRVACPVSPPSAR